MFQENSAMKMRLIFYHIAAMTMFHRDEAFFELAMIVVIFIAMGAFFIITSRRMHITVQDLVVQRQPQQLPLGG